MDPYNIQLVEGYEYLSIEEYLEDIQSKGSPKEQYKYVKKLLDKFREDLICLHTNHDKLSDRSYEKIHKRDYRKKIQENLGLQKGLQAYSDLIRARTSKLIRNTKKS